MIIESGISFFLRISCVPEDEALCCCPVCQLRSVEKREEKEQYYSSKGSR